MGADWLSYAASHRIDRWEPWQRDYRFGAFYLFPPDELRAVIDALRSEHDPRSAAMCSAHISVSDPLGRPLEADDIAELTDRLAEFEPFLVAFVRPHATPPYGGVA